MVLSSQPVGSDAIFRYTRITITTTRDEQNKTAGCQRQQGGGEGEMYQGGQKINKCWGCHVQHDGYSFNAIFHI